MPETQVIIALALRCGRHGDRRIKSLLGEADGWPPNRRPGGLLSWSKQARGHAKPLN